MSLVGPMQHERWRVAVFAAVAGFMALAPAWPQVLGERSRFARDWELFHELGVGLARVDYSVRARDGALTPIDRYAALGYADRRLAPKWLRTISGEAGVVAVGRKLCERLGAVEVRAHADIATMAGWVTKFAGEHDLCKPLPPRPIDPATRMRSHGVP